MPVVFGMFVCERTGKKEGEGQRDREGGKNGATLSLSKLIRQGIRMEVKY